jgi:hypothetical protein
VESRCRTTWKNVLNPTYTYIIHTYIHRKGQPILQSMGAHILQIQLVLNYSNKLLPLNKHNKNVCLIFVISATCFGCKRPLFTRSKTLHVNQRLLQCQSHKDGIPQYHTDVIQSHKILIHLHLHHTKQYCRLHNINYARNSCGISVYQIGDRG